MLVEDLGLRPSECLENLNTAAASAAEAALPDVAPDSPLPACEHITLPDRRQPIGYGEMRDVSG